MSRCPAEVTSCGRDQRKCNSNLLLNIKRADAIEYGHWEKDNSFERYLIIDSLNHKYLIVGVFNLCDNVQPFLI